MGSTYNLIPITTVSGERGFTLLEGMIATVILGIGLMGMGAMQGFSLMKNVDANELNSATILASDMMERILFNRRSVSSYDGIDTMIATNCTTIDVNSQRQARGDCVQWDTMVKGARLSGVRGTVVVSAEIAPIVLRQRRVAITLTWTDTPTQRTRSVTLNSIVSPN